jgi:hypothetical protein
MLVKTSFVRLNLTRISTTPTAKNALQLKNLDLINPAFVKPRNFCALAALLPLFSSLIGLGFIDGATPELRALDNPVAIFFMALAGVSLMMVFLPRLLNWGWTTTYFFIGILELGSTILMFGISWLCLLLYSSLPLSYRTLIFAGYMLVIFLPSRKIVKMYMEIKNDQRLFDYIYENLDGEIYYLQKNDIYLFEKKYKLSLPPSPNHLITWGLLWLSSVPFASMISRYIGLPYPHIFIGLLSTPINMMILAIVVRGTFVYYYLPRTLRKKGSTVYVDISTRTKLAKIPRAN